MLTKKQIKTEPKKAIQKLFKLCRHIANHLAENPGDLLFDRYTMASELHALLYQAGYKVMPKPATTTPKNAIAIIWSWEDVKEQRPDLSKAKACQVLKALANWHNAEIGINWQTIDTVSDLLFPEEA